MKKDYRELQSVSRPRFACFLLQNLYFSHVDYTPLYTLSLMTLFKISLSTILFYNKWI